MRERRKKYLVQPRLQLLFGLVFLSTSGLYVLLQAILLNWNLTRVTSDLPAGSDAILDYLVASLQTNLWVTFALMVPMTLLIGVYVTHRVVGPIHRFEGFLSEIVAGQKPADLHIRKDDELQRMCSLLNEATRPLRSAEAPLPRPTAVDELRSPRAADALPASTAREPLESAS